MFFFFKQKTAYELRISDWSSDVCSSDLPRPVLSFCGGRARQILADGLDIRIQQRRGEALVGLDRHRIVDLAQIGPRIGEAAQRHPDRLNLTLDRKSVV